MFNDNEGMVLCELLANIKARMLTDIRSETEYVDTGMIDDVEKKALQMIA
jgi:hypothetical protein